MALIVEDGSIVANADSYISLSDARDLAYKWGIDLPTDNTQAEVALRRGAQYIGLSEESFTGSRVSDDQALSWPRDDATRFGIDIPNDSINSDIKLAQVEAAVVYGSGTEVRPSSNGQRVSAEEIAGSIKISYDNSGAGNNVSITGSDDLLQPFLRASSFTSFEVGRA